jgi:Zn-dependent protease
MKRHTIPLGRILGIPIGLDPSWFLMFALVTWMLAASYFPSEFKNWPTAEYWIVGAVTAILFFASVVLHELGHSVLALRYKIPVTSITLFIFGGIAQIAAEPPSPVAEFVIALAGPLTSFALAAIFGLLQGVLTNVAPALAAAKYLAYINGTLALFNLIPGFPLDGGRVFRAIVWGATRNLRRATEIAATVGRAIAFLFILVGVWQVLQGNWANGLWIAFIGWSARAAPFSRLLSCCAPRAFSTLMFASAGRRSPLARIGDSFYAQCLARNLQNFVYFQGLVVAAMGLQARRVCGHIVATVGRDPDHGCIRTCLSDSLGKLETTEIRHGQVGDDQVEWLFLDPVQSLETALSCHDLVPISQPAQDIAEDKENHRIVIDDQNTSCCCHVLSFLRRAAA